MIIYIVYLFWSFLGGSINPVANHPLVHNPISVHWTCAFEPWFSKETWWFSMGQTHVGPSYKGCWKWIGGSSVYVHHCLALSVSWCNSWYNSWLLDAPFIYIYIYSYPSISINIHQYPSIILIYIYSLISLIAEDFPKSPPLAPVANDVRSQSSSVSPAISSFGLSFRNRASSWRSVEALVVLRPHVAPPDGIWEVEKSWKMPPESNNMALQKHQSKWIKMNEETMGIRDATWDKHG